MKNEKHLFFEKTDESDNAIVYSGKYQKTGLAFTVSFLKSPYSTPEKPENFKKEFFLGWQTYENENRMFKNLTKAISYKTLVMEEIDIFAHIDSVSMGVQQHDFSFLIATEFGDNTNKDCAAFINSTMFIPYSIFLVTIAALATYPQSNDSEKKHIKVEIIKYQKQIKRWAEQCPENNLYRYWLVEAELAKLRNNIVDAMQHYDAAIELAKKSGHLHEEALAFELAALFYLSLKKDRIAKTYLQESYLAYKEWGAMAKIQELETLFPELLQYRVKITKHASASSLNIVNLDVETIVNTTQAISGEIVLHELLKKLMKLVIENVGAENCFLMLEKNQKWFIEAEAHALNNDIRILQSVEYEKNDNLSKSVVNYVTQTNKQVLLNNAVNEGSFTTDSYIVTNKIKSLLCQPLQSRGKLIGILYLENNQLTEAFTEDKIELLKIIVLQAVISIENALLYHSLEKKVAARTEELQLAKEKAEEGEKLFDQIMEHSPILIYVKDMALKAVRLSSNFEKLVGIPIDDMIGKSNYELWPSDFAEKMVEVDKQILFESKTIEIEEEFAGRIYTTIKYPIYINQKPRYLAGFSLDITQRKEYELLLKQKTDNLEEFNRRFMHLADNLPAFIAYVNIDTLVYEFANIEYVRSFGISREKLIGSHIKDVISESNYQFALKYIEEVRQGRSATYENSFNMESGQRWIKVNYVPGFDKTGKIVSIITLSIDITEQKLLEVTLMHSEEKYRKIFNNDIDAICLFDIETKQILDVNNAYLKMYGYTREEALQLTTNEITVEQDKIDNAIGQETKEGDILVPERNHRKKDGTIFQVELSGGTFVWNGTTVMFAIARDITERKKAEIQIQKQNHQLLELNATKDKFFSIIAHDLKSPFNSLLGFSELLVEHFDEYDREKIKRFVDNIYTVSNQTFKLLENLLDWSRLQQGLIEPTLQLHNLKTIVNDINLLNSQIAKAKNICLQNNIGEDQSVFCDIDMTKTVLRNLISNAIKYTFQNGIITINSTDYTTHLEIRITDNGVGIPAETIGNLFRLDKNVSTRGTADEKGTGLGLLLCKELIEKQHGKIWVESELEKGSIFFIMLPNN